MNLTLSIVYQLRCFAVEPQVAESASYTKKNLQLVYNDYEFCFHELFEKDVCTAQHNNIQTIATDMSQVYNNLFEIIFDDFFIRQENTYNFRINRDFQIPRIDTLWKSSDLIR